MSLSAYVVWFVLAACAGWLFESTYAIVSTGHWERRGFLYGPACPIYGVGLVLGLLLFDRPEVASGEFAPWAVFLVSMLGSAVLEYGTSLALEKLFGAIWWDYTNMPLNINGRICLPASLFFGIGGVLIAYVVVPFVHMVSAEVPAQAYEIGALALTAMLASDLTASVSSLSDLMEVIQKTDVTVNELVEQKVQQGLSALREGPAQLLDKSIDGVESIVEHEASTARQALDSVQTKTGELVGMAERLSEHQLWMLGRLTRFSSADLREKAAVLRSKVIPGSETHPQETHKVGQ